jgi:hypothetical protein
MTRRLDERLRRNDRARLIEFAYRQVIVQAPRRIEIDGDGREWVVIELPERPTPILNEVTRLRTL